MDVKALIAYQQIRQIGVGQGMNSQVFVVRDPQRNEEVVAKEIDRPKLVNDPAKLFEEAHAICASNAPNVVPIYYACRTAKKICLVMPYYKNGSLADKIKDHPLRPKKIIYLGQQVLNGLCRIHGCGYIHFDIKPTNILFDDHDNAMVADFGQTRKIGPGGVTTVPPMYPFALPPEFYLTRVATLHSDIYHAGLMLYRAANGNPIFDSQKPTTDAELIDKTIKGKFPNRKLFHPHVPSYMRTVIRKALQLNPADRYDSASAMAQALANISVKHDWQMKRSGNVSMWKAERNGQPSLIVELIERGGQCDVEIYTERNGDRRAKDKAEWKNGLTAKGADKYLTELFDQLEHG